MYRKTICHQATYVRRDCFRRFGGFDLEFPVLADYELLLRLVLREETNARHVALVGTRYKADGFSASPTNRHLFRSDIARIRRRHFPCHLRVLYGLLWNMTLPRFRVWLLSHCGTEWVKRVYTQVANTLVSSRLDRGEQSDV